MLASLKSSLERQGFDDNVVTICLAKFEKAGQLEKLRELADYLNYCAEKGTGDPASHAALLSFVSERASAKRRGKSTLLEKSLSTIIERLESTLPILFPDRTPLKSTVAGQLFEDGLFKVAKGRNAPKKVLPDPALWFRALELMEQVENPCFFCTRTELMCRIHNAIPTRSQDIACIMRQTFIVDGNTISFNFRDRKHHNGEVSTTFSIACPRAAYLARRLLELSQVLYEKFSCNHSLPSDPSEYCWDCKGKTCDGKTWLFQRHKIGGPISAESLANDVKRVFDTVGIRDKNSSFTAKVLRKLCATLLLIATDDMDYIRIAGGWKDTPVIEAHYLCADYQVNYGDLREKLANLGLRAGVNNLTVRGLSTTVQRSVSQRRA